MDNLKNYINFIWKKYINRFNTKSGKHVFLDDLERVSDLDKIYGPKKITINPNTNPDIFNFDPLNFFTVQNCTFTPRKEMPEKMVMDIYNKLLDSDKLDWPKLESQLAEMSRYMLYSNVDLNEHLTKMRSKESDTQNVLVLGAGPTGLYIANYLADINMISPNINLLLLDNRIVPGKNNFRMPYNRNRLYGINFRMFSDFFPEFTCMHDLIKKGAIEIKYLENILIVLAYGFNVPMYFTDTLFNTDEISFPQTR
jgi:hypothetical protein